MAAKAPAGVLKKIVNDPFLAADEMLDGLVAAHSDVIRLAAAYARG